MRLPPRPAFLAGREGLLAELDARLASRSRGPGLVALCGLGGAGKTSLAVEYAHRHLAETGVCWLLPGEDPAVLAAEFAVLAAQLGARELADARDPVAAVHAVLAATAGGWLLVFDNAPDRASVERFLPPAGDGRVLVTTQSQHWPPGQALDVPVLDPQVAAEFLVSRTRDADHAAARELAAELGGLPLALEQAAGFMQATGTSLAGYQSLFRARQHELLARGEAAGHQVDVAATLGLALTRLARESPAAAGLARLLAFLAPEPAPLPLLLANRPPGPWPAGVLGPVADDPVALWDAVAALRRYSLVTPAGSGMVLVHRLVQSCARAQLSPDEAIQWQETAAALVEAAVPYDPQQPASWPTYTQLLPHALAALPLTSKGTRRIALALGHGGSYAASRDLFQQITVAHETDANYGPEHPDTLTVRADLANSTGEAGDPAGARDQYAALLPIFERVFGPEHRMTLAHRADFASYTGEAGDAAGAGDQYAALLPIYERVFGPEYPDTLTVRANIAGSIGMMGDAASARDQFAALLAAVERVSGAEGYNTLTHRRHLARWTGRAGDAAGARGQFAALVPVFERVFGAEHSDTLTVRAEHARWTGEAGDAAAARDQFAALLSASERVLGPEHAETLSTQHNLAYWTGRAGDAAAARDQFAALLPVAERVLGPEHPDTLSVRSNLTYWAEAAM